MALALPIPFLIARMLFGFQEVQPAVIIFVIPILVISFCGGLWPGLAATASSLLLTDYYLIPPTGSLHIATLYGNVLWFSLLFIGVSISIFSKIALDDRAHLLRTIKNLKRAEQLKNDVERVIRHDIKAPLASMHSFAEMQLEGSAPEELHALLPNLIHMIRNVIISLDSSENVYQMESSSYTPKSKWNQFQPLFQCIDLTLYSIISSKEITVVKTGELTNSAAQFFGEEYLIENMLMNLIKNAVEAEPRGGVVTVLLTQEFDTQCIDIHNHGTIAPSITTRFFDKYATVGKAHGTGMGTFSAKLIAEAHGGAINFTSSETEGTIVTVTLPYPANEGH